MYGQSREHLYHLRVGEKVSYACNVQVKLCDKIAHEVRADEKNMPDFPWHLYHSLYHCYSHLCPVGSGGSPATLAQSETVTKALFMLLSLHVTFYLLSTTPCEHGDRHGDNTK